MEVDVNFKKILGYLVVVRTLAITWDMIFIKVVPHLELNNVIQMVPGIIVMIQIAILYVHARVKD